MAERLQEVYKDKVVPELMKKLSIDNVMAIPKIEKIVVNSGIGSFKDNAEALQFFVNEFASITGQQPTLRKARLSVANFKIRKGDAVGVAVTLRGDRMWAFLDKLINIVLPRVRDFKGVSDTAFDTVGNYSLGLKEHTVFPEINANTTKGIRSLQVTVVTSTKNKDHSMELLKALGMPFRKDNN